MPKRKLRVVPLGGLGEIGKNMMALEYGNDIVVIDSGVMFPKEGMLGVDLVIPDVSYLLQRRERLRGIIITHGHEDHTGALPYIIPHFNVPIYATRLTHGLIEVKLKEHRLYKADQMRTVKANDEVGLGAFRVGFFPVNHSIPDCVGLIIRTPVGTVVHTGDFKFDHTPVDGRLTDFAKLAQVGSEGVLLLLSDSTYAEIPGYTPSEKVVGEVLDRIIDQAPGRVIIATFASLISRVQQIIEAAARHQRRVCVVGRSMVENVQMAQDLGYLDVPKGILVRVEDLSKQASKNVVLITTGSQGEPTSALVRIAHRDHRQIRIEPGDTVIVSATPIPGNEEFIGRTIDNLFRQGARVLYTKIADVHVHGHGSQEELKLMINLVRPRFFVPVHGEYRHLALHAQLAQSLGIPQENTFVLENGQVLELNWSGGRVVEKGVGGNVFVDGLGVGDVGQVVLRDRKVLSEDGIVVVIVAMEKQTGKVLGRPDIVSRGFVDMQESEDLIEETRQVVLQALDHSEGYLAEWESINTELKDTLGRFLYDKTKRRPMILPVAIEV